MILDDTFCGGVVPHIENDIGPKSFGVRLSDLLTITTFKLFPNKIAQQQSRLVTCATQTCT